MSNISTDPEDPDRKMCVHCYSWVLLLEPPRGTHVLICLIFALPILPTPEAASGLMLVAPTSPNQSLFIAKSIHKVFPEYCILKDFTDLETQLTFHDYLEKDQVTWGEPVHLYRKLTHAFTCLYSNKIPQTR